MPPSSQATAHAQAAELAVLVDTLIPGDGRWPSAATVGIQGVVAARLLTARGEGWRAVHRQRSGHMEYRRLDIEIILPLSHGDIENQKNH